MSGSVRLKIRDVSERLCTENQNTHFMCSDFFFQKMVPFMR